LTAIERKTHLLRLITLRKLQRLKGNNNKKYKKIWFIEKGK
jgi:hypothetical protein